MRKAGSGFECSVCTKKFLYQAQLNFHKKRPCNSKKELPKVTSKSSENERKPGKLLKFGNLSGITVDTTKPFRFSMSYIHLTDPKLFKILDAKRKVPNPEASDCSSDSSTEVATGSNRSHISTSTASLVSPRNESDDESDFQLTDSSTHCKTPPEQSLIVAKQPRKKIRIIDLVQGSANAPLASSTPQPSTSAQALAGHSRPVAFKPPHSKKPSNRGRNQNSERENSPNSYKKKCAYCSCQTFKTISHYYNHVEIHKGMRPFVCPTCQLGFKTDIKLLEHASRMHSNELVAKCSTCSTEFMTERELRNHEITCCADFVIA